MLFTADTLKFLKALKRNNRRDWFEAHRDDYERHVKAPMLELVEQLDVRLALFCPEIIGDRKRSMFRIYRDIRFSLDKSPYKTHAAIWLYHRDGSRAVGREATGGGAGFYFQIAPGDSFSGGGMWMPPRPALATIREQLAEDHRPFERCVTGAPVVKRFGGLDDDAMLKRTPRGYAPDNPAAKWLRYQSFTLGRALTDRQATSRGLVDELERDFRAMVPLVRWINGTLGLKPAERR